MIASLGLRYIDIIMQELRIAHLIENNDYRERTVLITVTKQAHTVQPFMNCTEHIWDYVFVLINSFFPDPDYKSKCYHLFPHYNLLFGDLEGPMRKQHKLIFIH